MLPDDLTEVVLAAAGLTSHARLLEARLAEVGARQGRGVRTMRRRLDDAKGLLSAHLGAPAPGRPDPASLRGWLFEDAALTLRVEADRSDLEIERTIRALHDGVATVTEVLFIPTDHPPGTTWCVEALEGCEFVGLQSDGPVSRHLELRLPHPLATGERHHYRVRSTVHPAGHVRPVLAMLPLRPCRRFTATLVLGAGRGVTAATLVQAAPPPDEPGGIPAAGAPITLPASARGISPTFADRAPGRGYGLAWTWADEARPAAVVFDLDGTLTDSEGEWDVIRRRLAAEDGVPWPEASTTAMMGMSTPEWSAHLVEVVGLRGTPADAARRTIDAMAAAYTEGRVPVLPGAPDAVRRMAAIAPLAVASSSPKVLIDRGLDLLGVADLVPVRVSTEEVARGKPHPDGYLEACRLLGADPADCVAIEDAPNGIRSAHAAGLKVVAIPPHFHPPSAEVLALADLVLPDLAGLTAEAARALFHAGP